jgi:hypothetical protein
LDRIFIGLNFNRKQGKGRVYYNNNMSLPTIEPIPDENAGLPSGQRRRRRRIAIPPGASDRGKFIHDLSLRTVPSFDYYLFSLLAGLILVAALLLDSPALFVLGALIAPFMAPAVGISLGTIAGDIPFVLQSLGSLTIGSLIVFVCGMMAGWAATFLPGRTFTQAALHAQFSWPDFIVLAIGAGLASFMILRLHNQKPLVASVAIAYELYLPACAAGFGLSSGTAGLWPGAITLFFLHIIGACLVGTLVMAFGGVRPLKTAGYVLAIVYAMVGVAAVMLILTNPPTLPVTLEPIQSTDSVGKFVALVPTPTPSQTATIIPSLTQAPPTSTVTPTHTLLPTRTTTLTISPMPTPVWARINASEGGGALVRKEADYNAPVVQSVLNGTLVEVMPEVVEQGGVAWVHIRLVDGRTGWVVRELLRTATPAVNW